MLSLTCFCLGPPFCQIKIFIKVNPLSEPMIIPYFNTPRIKSIIFDALLSRRCRAMISNNLILSFFFKHRITCLAIRYYITIFRFIQSIVPFCRKKQYLFLCMFLEHPQAGLSSFDELLSIE